MIRGPNWQKLYSQTAGSQSQVNTVSKTLHFAVTGKLRQKNVPINAQKLLVLQDGEIVNFSTIIITLSPIFECSYQVMKATFL